MDFIYIKVNLKIVLKWTVLGGRRQRNQFFCFPLIDQIVNLLFKCFRNWDPQDFQFPYRTQFVHTEPLRIASHRTFPVV